MLRRATPAAPRTAQAAMRHSSLDLTVLGRRGDNVYTDPELLDVAGAMEALPQLNVGASAGRHLTRDA